MYFLKYLISLVRRSWYMDLIEKIYEEVIFPEKNDLLIGQINFHD
jgi:hypothetical protein